MPLIRKPPDSAPVPAPHPATALSALVSGTADERWAAARAASGAPGSVKALGQALTQETDARVREAMFTSISRAATTESIEVVIPLLRSDDANLRTGALDALHTLKGILGPYVPRLLQDRDADIRVLSCELARDLPAEEGTKILCDLLEAETEPNVCAAAIDVLAEVGGAEALPVLARCLTRFQETPFLAFAIKVAADRIRSQSPSPRV